MSTFSPVQNPTGAGEKHHIEKHDGMMLGGKQHAWHGLGTVIDEDIVTSAEAIRHANLGWHVEQHPVYADTWSQTDPSSSDRITAHGYLANVRSDTREVLAIVSDKYVPVQNDEAFAFMDELLGGSDVRWHTAGSLGNGRRIFMLAKYDKEILIGNDTNEKIDPFICLATSHDGSLALSVYMTPIRVVCANTLRWSINGAKNVWRTRHTTSINGRIGIARETLGMSANYFSELERIGNVLINKPMSQNDFKHLLDNLVPLPPVGMESERGDIMRYQNAEKRREAISSALAVDNLDNVKATAWGFVQAVADYDDWMRPAKNDEVRTNRILFTDDPTLKNRSLELALNY